MTTYHVAMSCDGVLLEPPDIAGCMFKESATGRTLEAHEVYAMATMYKCRGFEFIPPCDNHDERGLCNGHEKENT